MENSEKLEEIRKKVDDVVNKKVLSTEDEDFLVEWVLLECDEVIQEFKARKE